MLPFSAVEDIVTGREKKRYMVSKSALNQKLG